jgi:hypothetical protein
MIALIESREEEWRKKVCQTGEKPDRQLKRISPLMLNW